MDSPSAAPCKLFIGGLSAQTTTEVLRGHFSKYGRIIDAVVMSQQGRPRGFGFVTFDLHAGADAALAEPQWLGDRFVDVKRAVPGKQQVVERTNKIFVGGLPQDATTEDLRACFSAYGPIADAVVMGDRHTKRSRGFGFIRFASGMQGTQAAEAVLKDAANHCLGGKWIEVKRATPADMLQDCSPGSCSTRCSTPASTPSHQQAQQHQQQPWFGSSLPAGMVTPSPQARRQRDCFSSGPAEMYNPHWNAAFAGFGLSDWEMAAADLSPMFRPLASPMGHFPAELSGLDPVSLSAGRLAAARDAFQPSFHLGGDATVAGSFEAPASCSSSSSGQAEENIRPAAANRAMTPPPVKKPMPPPGLGIQASPMKVEFPSKCFEFERLSVEDRLGVLLPVSSW